MDAGQKGQYGSYTLPANGEISFKLSMPREFEKDTYASHQVRVISAEDKSAAF
jgi:hypothetical protein